MTDLVRTPWVLVLLPALVLASPVFGAIDVGSTGSDGAFNPIADVEVDLSAAGTGPGTGTYDAQNWAVVFHYTSVNIPAGVTVTFKNHPTRAPVVWLVQSGVVIEGTVSLDGVAHQGALIVDGGPGGFRGGRGYVTSSDSSAGFGPGGAQKSADAGSGGSYGSLGGNNGAVGPIHGNDAVVPLIGGSGGSGDGNQDGGFGGGAGGGAILVATDTTVTVDGLIRANGGDSESAGGGNQGGVGSGGAIRLIADVVDGSGQLRAQGGALGTFGGAGRIRIEANSVVLTDTAPAHTSDLPCTGEGCTPLLWAPASAPVVRITDIDSTAGEYADPHSSFDFPSQDVTMADPDPVTVTIETENVPLTWRVKLRITPREGSYTEVSAVHQSGDESSSTWTVAVAFPNAFSAVQARACDPAQSPDYCAP